MVNRSAATDEESHEDPKLAVEKGKRFPMFVGKKWLLSLVPFPQQVSDNTYMKGSCLVGDPTNTDPNVEFAELY